VINITTGGGLGMSVDERAAVAVRSSPELCSMNMDSMNFGVFSIAEGISEYKNDWETGLSGDDQRLLLPQHLRRR
jgi:uncharacterized protein (DUF849 family)